MIGIIYHIRKTKNYYSSALGLSATHNMSVTYDIALSLDIISDIEYQSVACL